MKKQRLLTAVLSLCLLLTETPMTALASEPVNDYNPIDKTAVEISETVDETDTVIDETSDNGEDDSIICEDAEEDSTVFEDPYFSGETVETNSSVTVTLSSSQSKTYDSLNDAVSSFSSDFNKYSQYSTATFTFSGNVKLTGDILFPKEFPYVVFEPEKSETINDTVYYAHTLLDFNGYTIEDQSSSKFVINGISCISSTDDSNPGLLKVKGLEVFVENTKQENSVVTVMKNVDIEAVANGYWVYFLNQDPSSSGKTYIVDSEMRGLSVYTSGENCVWNMDSFRDCSLYTSTYSSKYRAHNNTLNINEITLGDNRDLQPDGESIINAENVTVDGGQVDVRHENGGGTLNVKDTLKVIKESSESGMATIYNYGYLYVNRLDMPCGMFRGGGYTDINEAINVHKIDNTRSTCNVLGEEASDDEYTGWMRIGTIKNMTSDGGLYIAGKSITQIDDSAEISNLILGQDVWGYDCSLYDEVPIISRLAGTRIDINGEFRMGSDLSDQAKLYVRTVTRSEDPDKTGSYKYSNDPLTTSGIIFTTNMKKFPVDRLAVMQPASTAGVYQDGNNIICGKKGSNPVTVKVTSVKINEMNPEVAVGQTAKLTYSYEPADASNTSAAWKTSNAKIANVDAESGEVTGIAPGTAKITVTVGGKTDSVTVTVLERQVPLTGLSVNESINLGLYESAQLEIKKTPEDATDKITCMSSDPSTVSVNDNGMLTTLKPGTAVITVSGGGFEAKCDVNVKAVLTGIKFGKTDIILMTGQKTEIIAETAPQGVICSYDWSVSVPQVLENESSGDYIRISANENKAEITALKPCSAEVIVTASDAESNTASSSVRITVMASDLTNSNDKTVTETTTSNIISALEEEAAKNEGEQGLWISGLMDAYEFNGMPVEPAVTVYHGTSRLRAGKDYSIAYSNNKAPNTKGTITITGKGSFTGKTTQSFAIIDEIKSGETSIKKAVITGLEKSYVYTGNTIIPEVEVTLNGVTLTRDVDYMLSCSKNTDVGTASLVITGIGNYKDSVKKSFKISAVDMACKDILINVSEAVYKAGGAIPAVSVTYTSKDGTIWALREGVDYKISFKNNKSISSKGSVIVTGQGNFTKKATADFDITAGDLSELSINVTDLKFKADQKKAAAYRSKVSIVDKDGKKLTGNDYVLEYTDITAGVVLNAGTTAEDLKKIKQNDKIMVTATEGSRKNYAGKLVGFYVLTEPKDINKAKITVKEGQFYDGTEKTPKLTVTWGKGNELLTEGTDYMIVSCFNNVKNGTAGAIVQGIGSFSGTKVMQFKINPSDVKGIYIGAWNYTDSKFVME